MNIDGNININVSITGNQSDREENYDDASADVPPEGHIAIVDEQNEKDNVKQENVNNGEQRHCEMCKYFYVIGNETYSVHAQEPWPKDVKLFQPYEVEQILLPDNANCLAVQAFLKMCNLDFQIESRPNAEFMSPTGKVPFIKCGAFLVAELEGVVAFVSQKGISLTDHLDPEQKADLRAYQALINNVLGAAENYVCWCDRETYREVTKPRNGSVYPWPLNLLQTWSKKSKQIKALKTLGWYEKSLEDVFQEVETCCQALTDRLENNTYFFGNKFTELDALLYGHIYTLLTTHLPTGVASFVQTINKYDKLVKHCKKVDARIMKRKTNFAQNTWVKYSKAKVKDHDKENYEPQDNIIQDTMMGDIGKEDDWLMIDKDVNIGCVGDTIPPNN